jgi:hypothetical protein
LHHLACHAEAGAEEHGRNGAPALSHALSGTLERFGLRSLQETPCQSRISRIPGELLQSRTVFLGEVDVEIPEA